MPDADFHMVFLSIQIMYECGVSFKSARYLQEYGSFHCFTLDLLGPKHELAPKQCKGKLFGWLVGWLIGWLGFFMIYVALAIFQPYRDLEAEINNL